MISKHTVGPRNPGHTQMGVSSYINRNNKVAIFTGSVTFYPKITKFAVEVSAYKGKLNFVPDVSEMPKDQSFSFLF